MEDTHLWSPTAATVKNAHLTQYMHWLDRHGYGSFADYAALWQWSVTDVGRFWRTCWDYFEIVASETADIALADDAMPGAVWFPGARLNYAENILAKATAVQPALIYGDETAAPPRHISWEQLTAQVAQLQATLRTLGVQKGDRVVAYLPNIPEAIISVLAVTGLGAIWSSCSPDFGAQSVLDRFRQIEPKVLIAVDGYAYNGKWYERGDVVETIRGALPTLTHTILIGGRADRTSSPDLSLWNEQRPTTQPIYFEQLPFDHPLWVLYSSGTTGLPKPIVHGHGGCLLEHAKATIFHNDLGAQDRFFWYTSTGWMMWNYLVGSLLSGCTAVLYNGSPAYPTLDRLWAFVDETAVTYFGLSPAFITACAKAGITPNTTHNLTRIRGVGSTGAPLTADHFRWVYDNINRHLALESLSGGTDLCTAFVGGARIKPVYAGEIQGASLGAKVEAFDPAGQPTIGAVGELVITRPMPSMPVMFWNDPGRARYTAAYFEVYPGVWRHGDWIKFNERGGCVIYGRSDSTINRKGIRMGTSEIYQCVEGLDAVIDCLVVDLEWRDRDSSMPMFVQLRPDMTLDDALKQTIKRKLRADISPRHTPDEIYQVDAIPYTLSGKKLEIPVRRILLGQPIEQAANPGAMRNPDALAFFVDLARKL